MDLVERGAAFPVEQEIGLQLFRLFVQLALYHERYPDVFPFIETASRDEIVHLWAQLEGLGYRSHDEMEPGVLEVGIVCVLFGQVLVDLRKVKDFAHHGFVLGAGAEHIRHHYVH